jgi:hypothetical protein
MFKKTEAERRNNSNQRSASSNQQPNYGTEKRDQIQLDEKTQEPGSNSSGSLINQPSLARSFF